MAIFALTGITLNHAGQIEAAPKVVMREGQLPQPLIAEPEELVPACQSALTDGGERLAADARWASTFGRDTEWSAQEVYVALPRPGGDAWLSIDRNSGAVSTK